MTTLSDRPARPSRSRVRASYRVFTDLNIWVNRSLRSSAWPCRIRPTSRMPTSTAETDSMPESTPNPTDGTNPAQNACGGRDYALDEVVGDGECASRSPRWVSRSVSSTVRVFVWLVVSRANRLTMPSIVTSFKRSLSSYTTSAALPIPVAAVWGRRWCDHAGWRTRAARVRLAAITSDLPLFLRRT